jgi:hypothetical protein
MTLALPDYLKAKRSEAEAIIAAKAARKALHLVKPSVAPAEKSKVPPHEVGVRLGERFAKLTRPRGGLAR